MLAPILKSYSGAAVQTFSHTTFHEYACLGPYKKNWSEIGVSRHHPSILGHRVRAAHHAYFWLLILRDALQEILKHPSDHTLDSFHRHSQQQLKSLHKRMPKDPIAPTPFGDNATCYTDYEPRVNREDSLKALAISGLASDELPHGNATKRHGL